MSEIKKPKFKPYPKDATIEELQNPLDYNVQLAQFFKWHEQVVGKLPNEEEIKHEILINYFGWNPALRSADSYGSHVDDLAQAIHKRIQEVYEA